MNTFIRRLIQYLTRKLEIPSLIKSGFTPNSDYFEKIYTKKLFGKSESASGPGSTLGATSKIRAQLQEVFKDLEIKSLVDIPCGDLYWMSKVNLGNLSYTGLDIVPSLIESLRITYPMAKFKVHDASSDPLEKYDLILCRDLFVHLTNTQICQALDHFRNSGSTYLLSTTFVDLNENVELRVPRIGVGWRPINLSLHPFNLGKPEMTINEESSEGGGKYRDKSLSLWRLN